MDLGNSLFKEREKWDKDKSEHKPNPFNTLTFAILNIHDNDI
jgi:hypothetical protein